MITTNNVLILGPVVIPLVGAATSLLFARSDVARRWIAMTTSFLAWLSSLAVVLATMDEGILLYRLGGYESPYGIVLVVDNLAAIFGLMGTTVVMMGILYAMSCRDTCMTYPAFMPLFLNMGAGLSGCFYTGDIFTLFVFIELMVVSSVVLVAISDNKLGLEAAIKYLFISSMGTLFILIGIAGIYTSLGTLNIADIARHLATGERPLLAQAAVVMLMSAFLVKSAVFPFHFWQPDFHTTAPTPVGALLSSVIVKVGVYGLIRLTTLMFIEEADLVQNLLMVLGLVGIFFGSLSALRTYDAKRMLAYSTFGQIGFILVAIGWGTPLSLLAAIVYAVNHSFIKASLLMLVGVVSSRMKIKKGAPLKEMGGLGRGMKVVSVLYILGGMALAGMPPMNGFISKFILVRGGIEKESWIVLGLVIAAGIITLLYMSRTWQLIFQQAPEGDVPLKPGDSPLAPLLLISLCVGLGLYATPLVDLAQETVTQLSTPDVYIEAVLGGLNASD